MVNARDFSATTTGLMHTWIHPNGTTALQRLAEQGWATMDYTPALVRSSTGLRVLTVG